LYLRFELQQNEREEREGWPSGLFSFISVLYLIRAGAGVFEWVCFLAVFKVVANIGLPVACVTG
jgi:hypothetical protein